MIKVKIKSIPILHFSYYQWLLLGLYELDDQKKIKFSLPFRYRLFVNRYVIMIISIIRKYLHLQSKSLNYCLTGVLTNNQGHNVKFAYDIADSPFLFNDRLLSAVDFYFKAQCPLDINDKGFPLTPEVRIPFSQSVLCYKKKIMPAMIGIRLLSNYLSFFSLKHNYNKLLKNRNIKKNKELVAYFGSALGPTPQKKNIKDYNNEAVLMDIFIKKINHPNEKRKIACNMLGKKEKYDLRIINDFSEDGVETINTDKIVPLKKFSGFIGEFNYNLNISGYRRSIPNRFIDSFIVGTSIITDKLAVKWYLPFEEEVSETIEMGYLKNSEVDWLKFKKDIEDLPQNHSEKVIELYENKWAPVKFAEYIVNICVPK